MDDANASLCRALGWHGLQFDKFGWWWGIAPAAWYRRAAGAFWPVPDWDTCHDAVLRAAELLRIAILPMWRPADGWSAILLIDGYSASVDAPTPCEAVAELLRRLVVDQAGNTALRAHMVAALGPLPEPAAPPAARPTATAHVSPTATPETMRALVAMARAATTAAVSPTAQASAGSHPSPLPALAPTATAPASSTADGGAFGGLRVRLASTSVSQLEMSGARPAVRIVQGREVREHHGRHYTRARALEECQRGCLAIVITGHAVSTGAIEAVSGGRVLMRSHRGTLLDRPWQHVWVECTPPPEPQQPTAPAVQEGKE